MKRSELATDTYGTLKHFATENYYGVLSKCVNSAVCTEETRATLRRITRRGIVYAHMGQLAIAEGVCYATFLQNAGNDGEESDSATGEVVLAVFSLAAVTSDGFDPEKDVAIYPLGRRGDTCAGYTAASIFKDNSMCLVGERLYICFSFVAEDGIARIFRKVFDTRARRFCDEVAVQVEFEGKTYDFSDETINILYRAKGLPERAQGLIELVSAWSEYNGEYYATGVTIGGPNNGFVVKTADFCKMTLVDAVPFNDMGEAEIASCVFADRLYVACRQAYGHPYLYLSYLDLKTLEWKEHYKIADGNSRPWLFACRDELYLLNTVEEYRRRYTNLSRVRVLNTPFAVFNDQSPVEIMATLKECGSYFATAVSGDDVYFVCTRDTESFGRLSMHFSDPDRVNRKLAALFAE